MLDLCKEFGWEDRLRALWAETELETERSGGGEKVDKPRERRSEGEKGGWAGL
ncbi:hypothetical protein FA13DRAFT_1740473, partial [Coprinellus micaceus]